MPEFVPSSVHKATITFSNPKSAGFDYTASLCMGVDMIEMASASFHLDAGQSKPVTFSVTMPAAVGTYPVYISVSSGGKVVALYKATEDVVIVGAADIRMENLVIAKSQVAVGEANTITVTAKNYGSISGTKQITCSVDGTTSEQTVSLEAGQSQPVSFGVTPYEAKTYNVSVDGLTGSFTATQVAPGLTKLFGIVTDAESGNAIIGLKVSIRDLFTYTDSLGYYLIAHIYEPLTPGSYTVTFEKPGYETLVKSIVLVAGDNELNVQMVPIVAPGVVTLTVLAPEDVAFKDYETYKLNDWYIMVGNDRWFVGQVGRYVRRGGGGARFQNVPIPRGATIKTARLHFISASDNTKTVLRSRIRGVAADSTTGFSTMEDYDSKLRNSTAAIVTWDNIPGFNYFAAFSSPEIKSIIQEIVNRPGWQHGNNLTLFWEDHEGRSGDARRVAYAYHPTYAPILYVELGW